MKRISKIKINNYRAYYDEKVITLPKGENLLVYGENGSGKSSLYKGLDAFVNSFSNNRKYIKNRYQSDSDGYISIAFREFDISSGCFLGQEDTEYSLKDGVSNLAIPNTAFLKTAATTKGFLDYKDLSKVYMLSEKNPNLFDLFITSLLRNHTSAAEGYDKPIGNTWQSIYDGFHNSHKRTDTKHKSALQKLPRFEAALRNLLKKVFKKVNDYLSQYFDNLNISLSFELQEMKALYAGGKSEWKITTGLYFQVKVGNKIISDYSDELNEARLSAISLCLYLAALKCNEGSDYKILFLDDVFIGLDAGNRRPILSILKSDFF